jgi:hypothetical protein
MSGKYFCNCPRYCGGTLLEVSRTTYFNHAPYRRARIGNALDKFLTHADDPGPGECESDRCEATDNDEGEDGHAIANVEVPNNLDVLPDDMRDDFDGLYFDAGPVPLPQADIIRLDDVEDLYVDPLPQEDSDDGGGNASDGHAIHAVSFLIYSFFYLNSFRSYRNTCLTQGAWTT